MSLDLQALKKTAQEAEPFALHKGFAPASVPLQADTLTALIARVEELEAENAHQTKVIEHYTARAESLKSTLTLIADRVDDFVYDELSSDIEDLALNTWGEAYESDKKRLEATLQRVRDARSNHPEIPECDLYTDDDAIKCGWKSAVESIDKALKGDTP